MLSATLLLGDSALTSSLSIIYKLLSLMEQAQVKNPIAHLMKDLTELALPAEKEFHEKVSQQETIFDHFCL